MQLLLWQLLSEEAENDGGFLRCHQKAVHRDEHGEGFPQGLEGGHQPLRNLWQHLDSIRRQGRDLPIQGQREVFGRITTKKAAPDGTAFFVGVEDKDYTGIVGAIVFNQVVAFFHSLSKTSL